MKKLITLAIALLMAQSAFAQVVTCDPGYTKVCHGGSGRGGGYHTTCTCNPTPCYAGNTNIQSGSSATLYTVSSVTSPDSCANHATTYSCNLGQLSPALTGTVYAFCNTITPPPTHGGDDS